VEPNPKMIFVKVKQPLPSKAFCFTRGSHCIHHSLTITDRDAVGLSHGIASGKEKLQDNQQVASWRYTAFI